MIQTDEKNLLRIFLLCLAAHIMILPIFSFVLPPKSKKPKYQIVFLYQQPQSTTTNMPKVRVSPQLPATKQIPDQKITIPKIEVGRLEKDITIGIPKTPLMTIEKQENVQWELPIPRIIATGTYTPVTINSEQSPQAFQGKITGENFEITGPGGNRAIVSKVIPEYPAWAEKQNIEANVKIKIWVNKHGHVFSTEIIETTGYRKLDAIAEEALKKWKFTEIDKDIDVWAIVTMKFRLQ
ncbi:MAG TPA: TonB family protein [bacterium]|nr:TonB family protein [bacterium]HPP08949.1 TonB family protein [bacterium]